MANLIVGEEPCTILEIVNIMNNSSVLCSNWKKFARNLGVREEKINKWRIDLQLDTIDLEDLLVDLLYTWRGRCGDDAALEVLCQVLTDSNLKDIADKVETTFDEMVKKQILATGEVSVQGHLIKISDIFAATADLPPGIVKQFKKNEPIQILNKFQIPDRPTYYIQRSLSPPTRLNPDVFKCASSDVFVLENLKWGDLDDKLFGSKVEWSSNQTVRVTATFILLDFERDYEQICKAVPSNTPVHLVRFDSGSYYWVRSTGNLALIQEHVSSKQEVWSEQEFVKKHLKKFENNPVCIADTPGMGKSLLLASIAQSVKKSCPKRMVLFMVLRELEKLTNSHVADFFWKQITRSHFAAKVLEKIMVQCEHLQFELFLDGYDEVLPNQLDSVNQLLLSLKQCKNIRIHITTRPHLRNQLEETLGVLGYAIIPFTENNQINFLTRFWGNCKESENEKLDESRLKLFASQCLVTVKNNMNEQERDIAGIPLQCALLAEVYAYDAVKYSINHSNRADLICKVESIFHMFQQLIRKKMEHVKTLGEVENQQLLNAHVYKAVELIFPEWLHKLTCIQMSPVNSVLYAVGLMEPSFQDAGSSPRFLHRTFAEFLIAEHLVKHLRCEPCSHFLFDGVLGQLTSPNDTSIFQFYKDTHDYFYDYIPVPMQVKNSQFSYNFIAYLVNAQLDAVGNNFQVTSWSSTPSVDNMLSACCLNNYPNIFRLLSKVEQLQSDAFTWTDMALLGARYSERNLMEQLVELIQHMGAPSLSELEFPKKRWSFQVTPLHVAVQRGSLTMTRYLVVDHIFPSLESLPYLLHCCVYKSVKDSDAVVEEKMEIIKLLVSVRKEVLDERLPGCNATPLLLRNVHVDLIETLIKQGVDTNAVDKWGNTVLHQICKSGPGCNPVTPAGYKKVFNLLKSSNFNLWDKKNNDNETPLYLAVKWLDVEHSVLDQYSQLIVNFNHAFNNRFGDYCSILFTAIRVGTPSFINKLEQLGADVNYVNLEGQSALHIAVKHGNYNVARYLVTKKNLVNSRDSKRRTPLHLAVLDRSPKLEAIQALLIDNGAELEDPEYKWRPTPLHHALLRGSGLSLNIFQKMVEKGLGAEHLALALNPLVRNDDIVPKGKGSEYSKLFQYLYEHGGRIQNAAEKLKQNKREFAEAIVVNDELLEQLKVTTGNDEVVRIHSANDLYDLIISGDIQLELVMLALLECNQLRSFKAIRELLRHTKRQRFLKALPEVYDFIYSGENMLVVAALDVELCAERVLDTIDVVEEYQEGMGLLPGTLCLVKVMSLERLNFLEYLGGLAQLPYRFIVVCEESLAAVVEETTCHVVRDRMEWKDLAKDYQDELMEAECIGFHLSQEWIEEFFQILRNESLVELIRNGRVSTDHFGRIIQTEVDQLDEQELKLLEEYSVGRLFPANLAEIMNAEWVDEHTARQLIGRMQRGSEVENHVLWFVAARAVLNAKGNDQEQMHQTLWHVFECQECQEDEEDLGNEEDEDRNTSKDDQYVVEITYWFTHEQLVFYMDWFVGRGYQLPLYFLSDYPGEYIMACLNSKAFNLVKHVFSIPNTRVFSYSKLLHCLVQKTLWLDAPQLELRVNLVLRLIRENPWSVNSPNQDNLPPLLMAKIHVELIDLLIYADANMNAVDEQGYNFVHIAARYLPSEQFQQLVAYLVDHRLIELLNARDSKEWTPLFHLVSWNAKPDPCMFQALKSAGADFNATEKNGLNVLYFGLKYNRSVEILEGLVECGADWRWKNEQNFSLLHKAAWEGNLEAVKYFVNLGLDVNSQCDNLGTPLMYAVINDEKECNLELIKFLLEHNVNVNAIDKYGVTALFYATMNQRNVELLEKLVESGADWSWKNCKNNNLLQFAAIVGNLEAVKYFVRLGCDVNARDNDLDTPLISAVMENDENIDNIEVVKCLLHQGADVNAVNKEGYNALYYAQEREQSAVYELLISKGAIEMTSQK